MLLTGKKVVVVGGSSGIGLATAELARREGAAVIIASRNAARLDAVAEKLNAIAIATDVTDDELAMFKTRARADLLRGLGNNQGLAEQLAIYQLRYEDWRELFNQLKKVDAVSKADIRRVANEVFTDTNRTVGIIENAKGAGGQSGEQGGGPADQGGAQ